jgi:hypothetical protein
MSPEEMAARIEHSKRACRVSSARCSYRWKPCAAMAACICLGGVDALAADPFACSMLTQQQISAAMGVAVGSGVPILAPTSCRWAGEDKIVTLTITQPRGGQSPVDQFYAGKALTLPGMATQPVGGVGDAAYYVSVGGTMRAECRLVVKKGSSSFEIRVDGFDLDKAKVVAKTLAQDTADKL